LGVARIRIPTRDDEIAMNGAPKMISWWASRRQRTYSKNESSISTSALDKLACTNGQSETLKVVTILSLVERVAVVARNGPAGAISTREAPN
jgi:hypothetical protein